MTASNPSPLTPVLQLKMVATDNTIIIIPKASEVHHNGAAALCWGPAWTSKGSFSFVSTHGPLTFPYAHRTVKNASSRFSSLKDKASQGVLCRRWEVVFLYITHDNRYTLDVFVVCASGSYACDVPCFAATSFLASRSCSPWQVYFAMKWHLLARLISFAQTKKLKYLQWRFPNPFESEG